MAGKYKYGVFKVAGDAEARGDWQAFYHDTAAAAEVTRASYQAAAERDNSGDKYEVTRLHVVERQRWARAWAITKLAAWLPLGARVYHLLEKYQAARYFIAVAKGEDTGGPEIAEITYHAHALTGYSMRNGTLRVNSAEDPIYEISRALFPNADRPEYCLRPVKL